MRVLALVDEPILEVGLRAVLARDSRLELVSVCHTDSQVASYLSQADVALINVTPEFDLRSLEYFHRIAPACKIVLWGRTFSLEMASDALPQGVRGVLRKQLGSDLLLRCLQKVGEGEVWMEQSLAAALLVHRGARLSRRENQLIEALSHGLKNKEIATLLGIKEGSVKVYLSKLYRKLGVKDRFDLALYGLRKFGPANVDHPVFEPDVEPKARVAGMER